MVPLMIWLLGFDQRRAAATSLAAIVPTAIAGSLGYLVNGELDLAAALLIALGGIGGTLIGTKLLRTLPLGWLRWMFIALLVLVAIRLFFEVPSRGADLELTPLSIAMLPGCSANVYVMPPLFWRGPSLPLPERSVGAAMKPPSWRPTTLKPSDENAPARASLPLFSMMLLLITPRYGPAYRIGATLYAAVLFVINSRPSE